MGAVQFVVTFERNDAHRWVAIAVSGDERFVSQGDSLPQARRRLRKALDRAGFAGALLDERLRLPPAAHRLLDQVTRSRDAAERAEKNALTLEQKAVKILVDDMGLSAHDAAALLGLSANKIAKLL